MAAFGVVCRPNVLLVFDISRAFSLSCFAGAGPCNKVKINFILLYFHVCEISV
jgi:hypothetical protein